MSGSGQPQLGQESADQAMARAQIAAQARRFGEAAGICGDVLASNPEHPSALALIGIVHARQNDVDLAIEFLERAIRRQAGVAAWYANLCSLYRINNQMDAAIAAGREAVRLAPDSPDNLVNLSLVLTDLDDRENAVSCLLRGIGLHDQHADAHLALAQMLLAAGDLDPGWIEYEWRNQTEAGRGQLPRITSAPWTGMRIPGGRVLLIGDQGYGDTIQFARYIPMVAERCEQVFLGCSGEMASLLGRIPGVSQVFHRWNEIPGHAAYCRLSSLALVFRTKLENIPQTVPYLTPEPQNVAKWSNWLENRAPRHVPRIGLAWSGRPTHPNDRRRSIRLKRLLPLADAAPAHFVSLQKPFPEGDLAYTGRLPGLADISDELHDFDDTAALISCLDMVISVDTSVAHLSGALGKPTWIMLPKASDWRWLLDRDDSPWYPTVRLFRQTAPGAWDALIGLVGDALREISTEDLRRCATESGGQGRRR